MKFIPYTNNQYKFTNEGEVYSLKQNRFLKCSNGFYSVIYEHGRRNIRKKALKNLYTFLNIDSKAIPSYSNYEITKSGDIYSLTTNIWVSPFEDKNGYKRIALVGDDNNRVKESVHKLVALTYIDNPNNYPVINHIDEDKQNNHVDNLEWCTISHNVRHSKPWLKRSRDEYGRFI